MDLAAAPSALKDVRVDDDEVALGASVDQVGKPHLGPRAVAKRSVKPLTQYRRVVILTGAGVSAPSGLPTFRGPQGLYEDDAIEALHHIDALPASAGPLWDLWGPVRTALRHITPNAAHVAIARFQQLIQSAGGTCLVVTQNVDGLHQRAGSSDVAEIHGTLLASRCTRPACIQQPWPDTSAPVRVPVCSLCGAPAIPDVVLFGERPKLDAERAAKQALRECDLFIAAGTSGVVAPAAGYVRYAFDVGARTVLANLTKADNPNPYFDETFIGPAEDLLPSLLGVEIAV